MAIMLIKMGQFLLLKLLDRRPVMTILLLTTTIIEEFRFIKSLVALQATLIDLMGGSRRSLGPFEDLRYP